MATTTLNRICLIVAFLGLFALCHAQSSVIPTVKSLFESRAFKNAKILLASVNSEKKEYSEALYYMGRIAVEEKKYELSIEKFESAIKVNPRNAEYHNWLGVMYGVIALDAGKIKQTYLAPKIKNEFEKAAEIDPTNIPTQWGLLTYYSKAPFFLGGSWDKAFACAAVIKKYDKAQGIRAYAHVHAGHGEIALAEKEYQEAINMEPSNYDHVFAMAEFYKERTEFGKSILLYEGVLIKNPGNMVAAFHVGAVSALSGLQTEKAIKCLTDYLTYTPRPNEPGHCDANLELGMIYEKKGDQASAKKYYRSSLQLYPGLKEAQQGLARLN